MKTLFVLLTAGVLLAADAPKARTRDQILADYFRLSTQWNAANTQLVQMPLWQDMNRLAKQVGALRDELAAQCTKTEELKDVPVNPSDLAQGTEPRCVAVPKTDPKPATGK